MRVWHGSAGWWDPRCRLVRQGMDSKQGQLSSEQAADARDWRAIAGVDHFLRNSVGCPGRRRPIESARFEGSDRAGNPTNTSGLALPETTIHEFPSNPRVQPLLRARSEANELARLSRAVSSGSVTTNLGRPCSSLSMQSAKLPLIS